MNTVASSVTGSTVTSSAVEMGSVHLAVPLLSTRLGAYTLREACLLIPLTYKGLQAYLIHTNRTWDRLTKVQIDLIRNELLNPAYAPPQR